MSRTRFGKVWAGGGGGGKPPSIKTGILRKKDMKHFLARASHSEPVRLGLWVGKSHTPGSRFIPWSLLTAQEKIKALRIRKGAWTNARYRDMLTKDQKSG
jgi:hypothetical protein